MNREIKQSAVEQLLRDKARLKEELRASEQNLDADFTYIRENASDLLLSGCMSLLFSSNKSKKKTAGQQGNYGMKAPQDKYFTSVSDWMMLGRDFAPVIWEIVQPVLLRWGVNCAKKLLAGVFSKKK